MLKILAIDPSVNALTLLANNLEMYGYELQGATDIASARNVARIGYRPEIVMVNLALCYQPQIFKLRELFQELSNPYLIVLAITDIESEATRMRARAMGFSGLLSKPFDIKAILLEIERITEMGKTHCAFLSAETRREQRFRVPIEVTLEIKDEESDYAMREQTVTEDISCTGASVLTMLKARMGALVAIAVPEHGLNCRAIVRGSFIGSDHIRRLNLEMIGKQWEEVFKKATGQSAPLQPVVAAKTLADELEPFIANQPLGDNDFAARVATAAEATLLKALGQVLNDRYELRRLIGIGGLGAVYEALDLFSLRPVAVKILLDNNTFISDEKSIPRQFFEREIQILTQITHANIVSLIDSGMSETGQLYLVMEYIEGETLDKLIHNEGVWSVARTLRLLKQLCPALHAMHLQKIMHRDMKPSNIMIQQIGNVEVAKILDFGIAKMVRGEKDTSLIKSITKTGMIVGTVKYISPEQCLGEELDERVDIYSLGMVIYELLCGKLPFEANSISSWLMAHVKKDPIPLNEANPHIHEAINQVVLWALAKQREDRPTSIMEFLHYFEEANNQSSIIARKTFRLPVRAQNREDSVNDPTFSSSDN
ncbi:MAG: protein kinase [Acidobacteriota bacterium]